MKETKRISLREYGGLRGLESVEDIIRYVVNKEDKGGLFKNDIPGHLKIDPKTRLTLTEAVKHAMSYDVGGFVMSFMP